MEPLTTMTPIRGADGRVQAWVLRDRIVGPHGATQAWLADGGVFSRVGTYLGTVVDGVLRGRNGEIVGTISDRRTAAVTAATSREAAPPADVPAARRPSLAVRPRTSRPMDEWSTSGWSAFLAPVRDAPLDAVPIVPAPRTRFARAEQSTGSEHDR